MGKVAFVFAGQGAQGVGMGRDLYDRFQSAREIFDLAGEKIKSLCFEGPLEELNRTLYTQPALFAMDLACARALGELGVKAQGAAGFSLGEIPAITYAGLVTDEEGFRLVSLRAGAMQKCADFKKGAMFAVLRLEEKEVEALCETLEGAYPVNYNAPGQTVVACAEETAPALQKAVSDAKGKLLRLQVSGAFHSPFMEEASGALEEYLREKTLREMEIPVYSNVTARIYDDAKKLLSLQVKRPVLWQKTIEAMIADGFDTFIEVGPGKTLSNLIAKINGGVRVLGASDVSSLTHAASEVKHA